MADASRIRGLTVYQAIQMFQRVGYRVERVGSGHFVLEHPARPPLQMPYREITTVAEGLILAHLRTAGFSLEEFLDAQDER